MSSDNLDRMVARFRHLDGDPPDRFNEVHIELVATREKGFDDDPVRDVAKAVHVLPFTMVSPPERSP